MAEGWLTMPADVSPADVGDVDLRVWESPQRALAALALDPDYLGDVSYALWRVEGTKILFSSTKPSEWDILQPGLIVPEPVEPDTIRRAVNACRLSYGANSELVPALLAICRFYLDNPQLPSQSAIERVARGIILGALSE